MSETNNTIHVAADHAGFALKEEIKILLEEEGFRVVDHGARAYDGQDDYPDFVIPAACAVAKEGVRGIVFGGSGQGEAIAANKIKGARAIVFYGGTYEIPLLGREHNDANMLSVGARFASQEEVRMAVKTFLHTDFSGEERHQRRIKKIENNT